MKLLQPLFLFTAVAGLAACGGGDLPAALGTGTAPDPEAASGLERVAAFADTTHPLSDPTLTPIGDGAALAGGNGATGTFNGTARTFTTQVGYAIVNNMTLFDALGDSVLDRWEVKGFQPVVGTQSCGTQGNFPMVRLALGGMPHAANTTTGGCTIEIISVSNTEVVGRFAARLVNGYTGAVTTVTDGYFRFTLAQ